MKKNNPLAISIILTIISILLSLFLSLSFNNQSTTIIWITLFTSILWFSYKKNFIKPLAFNILLLLICVSCFSLLIENAHNFTKTTFNKHTVKESTLKNSADEKPKKENQEKYLYILDSNKSYNDLLNDNVSFSEILKITSDKVDYDEIYKERVQTLKKQKDEAFEAEQQRKKSELDKQFPHLKIAEDLSDAKRKVELSIKQTLDRRYANNYNLKVNFTSANIEFLYTPDITYGELTAIARLIYDAYQDAGLLRTKTDLNTITLTFKISDQEYKSSWTVGESPVDSWNNKK